MMGKFSYGLLRMPHDRALLKGMKKSVGIIAWSPNGKTLASFGGPGTIIIWDVNSGEKVHTLEGYTNYGLSVAWSPDGKMLASGSLGGTISLLSAKDGSPLRTLEGHTSAVFSVAWSPGWKNLGIGK